MKALLYSAALLAAGAALVQAQNLGVTRTSTGMGFSFTVPADWDVVETSALAKEQARQNAQSEDAKKGLACAQIGLTARHGDPPSVMTEVALPFDCYGQQMTDADLPSFASSASMGLEQNFDLAPPAYGGYQLGAHRFWIERVKGAIKGRPDLRYTVEIACSITKKAAVCWMIMASNDAAISTFEHIPVSLDGETPMALVPANAFETKPS